METPGGKTGHRAERGTGLVLRENVPPCRKEKAFPGGGRKRVGGKALPVKQEEGKSMYNEGASASRLYRDEPIPGMPEQARSAGEFPEKYRKMRKLAWSGGFCTESEAALFYRQGKFMEAFEDDFAFDGEFVRYFPTYQAMSDQQLRGYISWRSRVRRGMVEKSSLSFAFVYLYELLNQIGTGTPEEGFFKLKCFYESYRKLNPAIERYAKLWLRDYVVYYNLDRSLLEGMESDADRAILTLMHPSSHSADEVFQALLLLSPYRMENSGFFKRHSEDVKHVSVGVFAALSEYYGKNRRNSLCEKFFGKLQIGVRYNMFRSAVFFDRLRRREYEYEISEICRYRCCGTSWSCDRLLRYKEKLKELGSLLRSIDVLMRREYAFPFALKEGKSTLLFLRVIQSEIGKFLESKRKRERLEITLDLSRLPGIREDALATQKRLIAEAPEGEEAPPPGRAPSRASSSALSLSAPLASLPREEEEGSMPLSEEEQGFLLCLLGKGEWASFARERKLLPSVLVDSINEKLFGRFGDTVIGYAGDFPEVIEEYSEELRGLFQK